MFLSILIVRPFSINYLLFFFGTKSKKNNNEKKKQFHRKNVEDNIHVFAT